MTSFKDITSLGGDGVINLGFDTNIPKYDPSSFYNYEEDNIPLWSLEANDRTLYEALGSPGGNPDGVTMTLSSTGNFDLDQGIYDSIDDIIERIPKRLKYPVRVELCAYGDLGHLGLLNITCEGAGRIEFINKVYAEDLNGQVTLQTSVSSSPEGALNHILNVSSNDFSGSLDAMASEKTGSTLLNTTTWDNNARVFAMVGPDTDREAINMSVHVASATGSPTFFGANNRFLFKNYGKEEDNSVTSLDAAPKTGSGLDFMVNKKSILEQGSQVSMAGFGSYFSSIEVKDCQGTVKFTNILVDSASGVDDVDANGCAHRGNTGWDIENSEVILDNCASIRNIKQGFFVKNSRVKSTGHLIAWRNYTKADQNNRNQDGVGLLALNSDIEFDSTLYDESRKYMIMFAKSKYGLEMRNSTLRGGVRLTSNDPESASGLPNGGSQNNTRNIITGGLQNLNNVIGAGGDRHTSILHACWNTDTGIKLEGSDVEFRGRISAYLNQNQGLDMIRTESRLTQFTLNHNGDTGLRLKNSNLTYGWEVDDFADKPDNYSAIIYASDQFAGGSNDTAVAIRNRAQFNADANNQNIVVDRGSTLIPFRVNSIPTLYGRWGGGSWTDADATYGIGSDCISLPSIHYGATYNRVNNLPAVLVTNNSTAEFVNFAAGVESKDTGKGKVAVASNGSNLIFRGTSGSTTTMSMYPVNDVTTQFRSWLTAAVVAMNNSTLEMTGPTKISRFGIGVLAESGSQFSAKPPTLLGTDSVLDVSGYNLDTSGNHTTLEVHSTRAALVANKKSSLNLVSLGGTTRTDGTTVSNSVDVLTNSFGDPYIGDQNNQYKNSTVGGYVKFYPNGFTSSIAEFSQVSIPTSDAFNRTKNTILDDSLHSTGTTGGMCVRAIQDSSVDVNLVNFKVLLAPADLSGAFYNLSGTGAEYAGGVGAGGESGGFGGNGSTVVTGTEDPPTGNSEASEFNKFGTNTAAGQGTGASEDNWTLSRIDPLYSNRGGSQPNNFPSVEESLYSPVVGDGTDYDGLHNPGIPVVGQERYGDVSGRDGRDYIPVNTDLGSTVNGWNLGSRIHIWNIADTSRIHAANTLVNYGDPETYCSSVGFHGPGGKWANGVALDYYGHEGRRTTYGSLGNEFHNHGVFRLIFSTRGDLKTFYGVSSFADTAAVFANTNVSGGIPVDQVNGAGYQFLLQNVRTLDLSNERRHIGSQDGDFMQGIYQLSSCGRVFGWGAPACSGLSGVATMQPRMAEYTAYMTSSNMQNTPTSLDASAAFLTQAMSPQFPIPPLGMDWQGYMRHWLDETAANTFQNAKHLSEDKVNGVSIYRSVQDTYKGGEGRDGSANSTTFGAGVRSLNLFDLERLL